MKKTKVYKKLAAGLSIVILSGCSSITDARNSQSAVAGKSIDDAQYSVSAAIDLKGARLEHLVGFALTNHPLMVASSLAVKDERLALKQLHADAPIVSDTPWTSFSASASAGYDQATRPGEFGDLKFTTSGDPSLSVSLGVLVWDFGRYDAKARSQAEKVVAAEYKTLADGYSVFENVANAYFSFLERRAMLEVANTNEYEYAVHLARAEDLVKAGEAKQLDLLRARLDLAQAKEEVVNAKMKVETSAAELMQAIGLNASEFSWRETIDPDKFALDLFSAFEKKPFSAEQAFSFAQTNSPAMRIARSKLRAASADVDYAIADLMPELSASTSLSWTDPLWVWRWGADLAGSLFQGRRKVTGVDRAKVRLEQASVEVDREAHALSVAIEVAVAERDNSLAALATSEDSLQRSLENLNLVKRQYEVGDANRADYTEAVADYIEAMASRLSAFYRGQRAEAAIFRLIGLYPQFNERWISKEKSL